MIENKLLNLSRQQLAQLGREYMLAAQVNSRAGYAKVRIDHGENAYLDVAIPNWLGASPVYTGRMQRAMGFADQPDVEAIFKGLQLECGLSHQYFDACFELESSQRGSFYLDSCGALLEAEPRGPEAVKVMCHDIEDPTFDATAVATNPQARMRPYHRPPRQANSTGPVCKWDVFIDKDAEHLPMPEEAKRVAKSLLAQIELDAGKEVVEQGGMDDYSGDLHSKLALESFSQSALTLICQELGLQNNLLVRAMLMVVADLYGEDAAAAVGEFQMIGSSRVVSERLCRCLGFSDGGLAAIAEVLALHPAFQPIAYSCVSVQLLDDSTLALNINPGPAMDEADNYSWLKILASGNDTGLKSLLKGIDKTASCRRDASAKNRWLITVGNELEQEEHLAIMVCRGAVVTGFDLKDAPEIMRIV